MRRWWGIVLAALLLIGGAGSAAAQNAERRMVLAVLPILVDGNSEIHHPQAEEVKELLRRISRGQEETLARQLREGGRFFDVRLVKEDPSMLASELLVGRTASAVAGRVDYLFNPQTTQRIADTVPADRLLVLILHGQDQKEKRHDRGLFTYLEASYNSIVAQAALLDAHGQALWRWQLASGEHWLPLQYANFDEAYYNKSDKVPQVWLFLEGLERHLTEKQTTVFNRPSPSPKIYLPIFDEVVRKLHGFMER